MAEIICTGCKQKRPAGEAACPHCGAAAYPHRRTAAEHEEYLRAVAEHDLVRDVLERDRLP